MALFQKIRITPEKEDNTMFQMKEIGRRIAEARRTAGLTQPDLAEKMGISFQAVSNWERGESMPDIAKLPELAAILGMSIDALLGVAPMPTAKAESAPEPDPTPEPEPAPEPTPELTPEPTPEPEPQMEVMGSGFNKSVLAGVNEVRAQKGNAPLKLDSGLCAKALAHAKEMAERGETFHSCGGAESVTGSTAGGKSIGIRSAGHATGLALDADRSRLGVGSVKIGGKQYTCVFSPRD